MRSPTESTLGSLSAGSKTMGDFLEDTTSYAFATDLLPVEHGFHQDRHPSTSGNFHRQSDPARTVGGLHHVLEAERNVYEPPGLLNEPLGRWPPWWEQQSEHGYPANRSQNLQRYAQNTRHDVEQAVQPHNQASGIETRSRVQAPRTLHDQLLYIPAPPTDLSQTVAGTLGARLDVQPEATTLMVRNIPVRYTQEMLLKEWPNDDASYNFLYLPICIKRKCNASYCFINFVSHQAAVSFAANWHHKRLACFSSRKPLDISLAELQGLQTNLSSCMRNKTSRIRNSHFQPVLFAGKQRINIE
eukprot:CAMPEP_0197672612 /NCGR_PEP_ID=MMETSP1338-20131121/79302_1 /TAXON_ID=43686 ORGANISM="Pelagodinium beii, Strain RCC1491" /NCGR_SAMPLE_ID=MMETSP1338 /ASSEMBLY_ACC=CAM_ASM_000754 /LENGTH=300 /DNA_ID=CAMNT_0043252741 /DNA_START=203 /DNA_END=1102 /DNA_ORIENTATION=-